MELSNPTVPATISNSLLKMKCGYIYAYIYKHIHTILRILNVNTKRTGLVKYG